MDLSLILQLFAAITTLWAMWLMGNKKPLGPLVAIVSELVWFWLIAEAHLWGLLPLSVALLFVHARNAFKWRRDDEPIGDIADLIQDIEPTDTPFLRSLDGRS